MRRTWLCIFAFVGSLMLTGCPASTAKKQQAQANANETAAKKEAEIRTNLATLSPQDRKLAEAQKWCAVETDSRLGSMDAPVKIEVDGQPVFLCCSGCAKTARRDPAKTLATVAELKKKTAAETTP